MTTTKKKEELEQQQNQTTQQTTPTQSSTVQQAQSTLKQLSGRNYQSQWQPQINDMMNQYLNRDKFTYDLNADALYNQLRDQYRLMGQQAMMDTMGQAAMLTGGYGNSYAQSVGQQAYQGYLQQLSDKVPDLYQLALDQYINEGNQMQDNIGMMMQQDSLDYDRYRDQMADQDDAYDKLVALMTGYGYKPTADELAYAGMTDAQYRAIMGIPDPSVSSGGGDGGGRGSGGLTYDTQGYTVEEIKAMQEAAGIAVDGIWGPDTQNAYDSGYRPDSGGSGSDYYEQLLGAVSTAKGASSKQDWSTKQETYRESTAAINDAYQNGQISEEQRKTLLGIATPGSR